MRMVCGVLRYTLMLAGHVARGGHAALHFAFVCVHRLCTCILWRPTPPLQRERSAA